MAKNQCQSCGACCAFYPVIFPSYEISNENFFSVPINMTHHYDLFQSIMKGTESKAPRCAALIGNVGYHASCSIYHNRPSTCRKFEQAWKKNLGNHLCDKARSVYGLQPFSQY